MFTLKKIRDSYHRHTPFLNHGRAVWPYRGGSNRCPNKRFDNSFLKIRYKTQKKRVNCLKALQGPKRPGAMRESLEMCPVLCMQSMNQL